MIILSNTTEQTLAVGQSITFDNVVQHTGCDVCFRNNSGAAGLRAIPGTYAISFSGNVGGTVAAAPVQLSVEVGGAPLAETTMISTPAAVGDLNNVATSTRVQTCAGLGNNVTVTNTGTNPIVIGANSNLTIARVG